MAKYEGIKALLFSRAPQVKSLPITDTETGFKVGNPEAAGFEFIEEEEHYTLACLDLHGHFHDAKQAILVMAALLQGSAIAIDVYRNDDRAYSWFTPVEADLNIEEWGTETYFLNPLDGEEWEPHPGDEWIQNTVSFCVVDDVIKVEQTRRELSASEIEKPVMVTWLAERLGQPQEGFRWLTGPYNKFAFLAPCGWRFVESDREPRSVNYVNAEGNFVLRAANFFRESSVLRATELAEIPPDNIEEEAQLQDEPNGWNSIKWSLHFSGGPLEMLGIIQLFWLGSSPTPTDNLLSDLRAAVKNARYLT